MNDIVSTEARGHRPKLMSTPEEKGWVGSPPLACNSSIETRITNVRVTAVSGDVSLNVLSFELYLQRCDESNSRHGKRYIR